MAFNWGTFWTRAFTALIFVAIMMFGLLYSNWSLFLLISVIYFGCWWEYCRLAEKIIDAAIHPYIKLGGGLLGYHVLLLLTGSDLQIGAYSVQKSFVLPFAAAGIVLFTWGIFKTERISKKLLLGLLAGLVYTALPAGLLLNLSAPGHRVPVQLDHFVVLFIIGSVWINDTMAYLAGSAIGRTPLSKISPKKTWEGTLSGILLSASFTWLLFSLIFFKKVEWSLAVPGAIISTITAVSGTFGDLFESKLKRMAGVKDSGRIMPGHGGFLDRFDSVLFAAPVVWLFTRFFY
ncbi:phosphatidate cytidylyltransferase [Niabella aquatica]